MAGLFFLFVMTVALGSLVDGYLEGLKNKGASTTIRFTNEDKMVEGELF